MSEKLRHSLLYLRDMGQTVWPFILLATALLALAYWWLDPNPPKRVVLATGPAQSAYDEFGKRYAKILAARGIEVVLLPSEGSSDNLRMVQEGAVISVTGKRVPVAVDTICVHGDNPAAVAMASEVRSTLERSGVDVRPLVDVGGQPVS